MLDAVTKHLIEIFDQHSVFQQHPSLSNLIKRARLPLKNEHFEVNCVPYYDPGLLSISILSTHEGLQLKKMINDEWIDGPLESNIGVIWLGERASRITKNRLKAGIHRVIYPQESKRRLTIWYEICTTEQLKNISDKMTNEIMAGGMVTFNNLPGASPIPVFRNERRLDFLRRVEWSHGLTMTKAPPLQYILPKHDISFPTDYSNTNYRGAESSVKQSRLHPRTNLSSNSHPSFHRYYTQFLLSHLHRSHSLHLLNSYSMALVILLLQNTSKFSRLHNLILDQIDLVYLENLLLALITSPCLSSLNIIYNDPISAKTSILNLIFHFPNLKHCKITFKTGFETDLSPVCVNKYSSIRSLYLKGECKLKNLLSILSYTLLVRCLSVDTLNTYVQDEIENASIILNYLKHCSVRLGHIQSHQFIPLITKHFPNLQVLHLSMETSDFISHSTFTYFHQTQLTYDLQYAIINLTVFM
ncbi:hypothetical protein I4U23_022031 [Adineta vaga]|nr:hypothetical protein I4U23_022031 [Adineta vaga]